MAFRITAPMVSAVARNQRVFHLFLGDVVPADITEKSLENLKSLGFVEEFGAAPEPEPGEDPEPPKRGPGRPSKSNPTA